MRSLWPAALLALATLGGCGNTGIVMLDTDPVVRHTEPTSIEFLETEPSRPYKRIAYVMASNRTGAFYSPAAAEAGALEILREQAGRVGADAVLFPQVGSTDAGGSAAGSTAFVSTGSSSVPVVATSGGVFNRYHHINTRAVAIRYTDDGPRAATAKPRPQEMP
jgi:hypothetical protein